MTRLCLRLQPASYLIFLAWVLLLVALLPDRPLWLLLVVTIIFDGLGQRTGWRVVVTRQFWFFILSILVVSVLILGQADARWGVLRLSQTGFEAGVWMALRAAALMLAFSASLAVLTVSRTMDLFNMLGLRGLGFALGVAMNLLPALREVLGVAYHTMRLRGGWRRPIQNVPLFLVTIIANALRYGDDVVKAASARAFDPAASLAQTDRLLGWADVLFIAGLTVIGVGLLLWV
jgi:energy-coupling factor transporter transmembrane protein EcfT